MNRVKRQFMQVTSFGALHSRLGQIAAAQILDAEPPSPEAEAAAQRAAMSRPFSRPPRASAQAALVNHYPYEVVLPLGTGAQQAALERLARVSAPYVVQNLNGSVRWAFDNVDRRNRFGKAVRKAYPTLLAA